MFSKSIIETDDFLDMPMPTKALYFLLGMEADDEGFVSPKRVMRLYGGNEDDLRILIAKNFVIYFKSGVVVITDWKENNYLNRNRIKETHYIEEKSLLSLKGNKYAMLNKCLADVQPEEKRREENRVEEKRREDNLKFSDENFVSPDNLKNLEVSKKTPREFTNARRKQLGKEPLKKNQTEKQISSFTCLKLIDFFKDKVMELHRLNYLKRKEDLNPRIRKQVKSCLNRFNQEAEKYIIWFLENPEFTWTKYEPTHCFSNKFYQLYENRDVKIEKVLNPSAGILRAEE